MHRAPGRRPGQGTRAYAINPSGTLTGFFLDSTNAAHAYVRSKNGVITVFDAPGAGTGPFQGTFAFSPLIIAPNGSIAGYYVDSANVSHGFLRDRNGTITTFDAPGAGTGAGQGTFSYAISPNGAVTGYFYDAPPRATGSCGTGTASSPLSIFRAPVRTFSKALTAEVLLRMAESLATTSVRTLSATASSSRRRGGAGEEPTTRAPSPQTRRLVETGSKR